MQFTGLDPDAPRFFRELAGDNTRAWWEANRHRYDALVRGPFEALAEELEPEFGDVKIFRPNRDVRFSTDKSPYKVNIGMVSRSPVAFYLQLDADGIQLGGGSYDVPPPALARFRELVDDDRTATPLERLLGDAAADGFTPMAAGALKSAPRGYPVDHPRIALLRLRHLAIGRREEVADWMWSPDARDTVADGWRTVARWNRWLTDHLGDLLMHPAGSRR